MRYFLFLFLFVAQFVSGQGVLKRQWYKQYHSLNNNVYTIYRQFQPADVFNDGVSFSKPGKIYHDGDYSTAFNAGGTVYNPCTTYVQLGGTFTMNSLVIHKVSGSGTFKVLHGNNLSSTTDIFSLTADTTITLGGAGVVNVNLKNTNIKFLVYVLSSGDGPAEIELIGSRVTADVVPAITYRPSQRLKDMMGWNADEFTAFDIPVGYVGNSIREYDNTSKLARNLSKFSLNPGYDQGLNFDQRYLDISNLGRINTPVFFDFSDTYDSIFKPAYQSFGLNDGNTNFFNRYLTATAGIDKTRPLAWDKVGQLAYQMILRWGNNSIISTSNANLESNNTPLVGLNRLGEFELGNEHDLWWLGDTNTHISPMQAFAKLCSIWDGDEGRLGTHRGVRSIDTNVVVIAGANADFNYGYNKIIHFAAKKFRADGRFPAGALSYHSYLTRDGGQHNTGDKGIAPELYTRPGYKARGLEQYALEHGDYELRYLPGLKRYYSEFGYDTNKDSESGVPMLTAAQRDTAKNKWNTWEVQGMLLQRHFLALLKCRAFDKAYVYSYFDYKENSRTLPDYASDTRNPNNTDVDYDPYSSAKQFSQSGVVGDQNYYALGHTASPVDLTTAVGQTITFTLPADRAYWQFSSPLTLRYAAEDSTTEVFKYQDNKITGNIVSQNDSVVVLTITSTQFSPEGPTYHVNNISEWRFDTPYAPKTSKIMLDNMMAVMGDCYYIADSSKGNYKDYRFTNGSGKTVAVVWYPTQDWYQIDNIQINVGSASAVAERINPSRTGATQSKTVTSHKITTSINEMPKFFYY